MSTLLRRIKGSMLKTYAVTVEIKVAELPVHQHELYVEEYNRKRAKRKATSLAIQKIEVEPVSAHLTK